MREDIDHLGSCVPTNIICLVTCFRWDVQQDGEGIPGARIQNTVAAGATINGAATVEVRVCKPCCATLSVKNVGATAATVSDANLVVSRIG